MLGQWGQWGVWAGVVLVVLAAALWWQERQRAGLATRRANELERERDRLRNLLEQASRTQLHQQWARWWLLNALESHPATNPEREAQLRHALAAVCVRDVREFVEQLRRIAASETSARNDRHAAQLLVSEWDAAQLAGEAPWVTWQRATGRGWAEGTRLSEVSADALKSWRALLGPTQFALVSITAQPS